MAKVGFWLKGARGKLGGASMGRGADGSTIIREIKTPSNPKTAAQALQRMKLGPAQKFYTAFSELLSNAFESVAYGGDSRRYFLAKIMKLEGPYIQKGVERFIPAAYPFSEGSLPSIGIEPFSGGTSVITLSVTTDKESVTNEELASLLMTTSDAQITIAVVNNVNGLFQPSYISYADRLTIADIPENAIGVNQNGNVTLSPAAFGLNASAIVAMCVVISKQDASGKWLRSTQEMIISEELRSAIYSADAMEAAIYSYQDGSATNTINSEWYFNLGMSQAWPGKLATTALPIKSEGSPANANVIIGVKQLDGRIVRTVFATALTDDGLVICLSDSREIVTYEGATLGEFKGLNIGYQYELWQDSYATQLGIYGGSGQIAPTPTPTPPITPGSAYYRKLTLGNSEYKVLVDAFGRVMTHDDGNATYGFAWGGEEGLPDFDNASRYSEKFRQATNDWGFVNNIVSLTGNTLIFNYNGGEVVLNYNNETNDTVPTVPELTNATPDLFSRTITDVDNIKIVVNENGNPVVVNGSNVQFFLEVGEDGGEMTISLNNDATKLAAIVAATGQAEVISYEKSGDFYKYESANGYKIVTNQDDFITFGAVSGWTPIFYRVFVDSGQGVYLLVDKDGHILTWSLGDWARGFYASMGEQFDPTDSWDEGGLPEGVKDAWGANTIALDNESNFTVNGVEVHFTGNGFSYTPAPYNE